MGTIHTLYIILATALRSKHMFCYLRKIKLKEVNDSPKVMAELEFKLRPVLEVSTLTRFPLMYSVMLLVYVLVEPHKY